MASARRRSRSTTMPSGVKPGGVGGTPPSGTSGSDVGAAEHEHALALGLAPAHLVGERAGAEHLGRAEHQHLVRRRRRPTTSSATRTAARGGQRARSASRPAPAAMASLVVGAASAERADHAAPGSRGRPPRASRRAPARPRSARGVPSVSVPVLSRQTVSTPASDSTAFSCCTMRARSWRCARRPTASVTEASSTRPSGTIEMRPAVAVCAPSRNSTSCSQQRGDERRGERHHRHQQPAQQRVDLQLQRREAPLGGARLRRSAWREGVGADGPTSYRPLRRRRTKAPDSTSSPGLLADVVGLAGEDRLVQRQAGRRRSTTPSASTWSPGCELDDVAGHDVLRRDLQLGAVAAHAGARGDEQRELVELALGQHLLRDADAPC